MLHGNLLGGQRTLRVCRDPQLAPVHASWESTWRATHSSRMPRSTAGSRACFMGIYLADNALFAYAAIHSWLPCMLHGNLLGGQRTLRVCRDPQLAPVHASWESTWR